MTTMTSELSILAKPMQPGVLRQCPECRRMFALSEVRVETDGRVGEVRVYCCRWCGCEKKFVGSLPPHVV